MTADGRRIRRAARRAPCLSSKLRRAARLVAQLYDEEMRPSGLGIAQFGLLGTLSSMGETTQAQLAKRLNLDSTTLTRTLAPLSARRWIEKAPSRTDRRERRLRLTPAGLGQLREAFPRWEKAQRHTQEVLGKTDWNRLQELLSRVIEAAQRD